MPSLLIFMKSVLYFPSGNNSFTRIRLIHIIVRWCNFDHFTQDMLSCEPNKVSVLKHVLCSLMNMSFLYENV